MLCIKNNFSSMILLSLAIFLLVFDPGKALGIKKAVIPLISVLFFMHFLKIR